MFTLRKGTAQTVITTTPRPSPLMKEIEKRPTTVIVRGSSKDNLDNLSPAYVENVIKPYEGTALGLQEIEGQDIEDTPGALWKHQQIEDLRVSSFGDLTRIVVAIDPAATDTEDSDETGIVVAGLGADRHGYVLDDKSLKASPNGWAKEAIACLHRFKGDRIVAETNNGGDMVESTLRTVEQNIPYKKVVASRGKRTRAEPVSALYEQGKVHHVGSLSELEAQMCTWVPDGDMKSPDRIDALVWAITELMLENDTIHVGQAPDALANYRGG